MISAIDGLPGWRHLALGSVKSTNEEAFDLASSGDTGKIWVTAESQSAGRARRGRRWVSEPGNLYASLLLIDPASGDNLATLPLVASVALHCALINARPQLKEILKIKWPNDLLLEGKKLSGILLEAQSDARGRLSVAIGCGVNCQHCPENPLYPATSLCQSGVNLEWQELFNHLAIAMARELRIWSRGQGFATIRRSWLDRSEGLGGQITARLPGREIAGIFVDLDDEGMLLLRDSEKQVHKISAADIFFGNSGAKGA